MESLSDVMRGALQHPPSASKTRKAFEEARNRLLDTGEMSVDGSFVVSHPLALNLVCLRNAKDIKSSPRESAGAIAMIFGFYNKLQSPAAQLAQRGLTYEEIMNCNQRISYYELLLFCRDFGIVPGLVSKQNIEFIWKVCLAEHNRSSNHFRHTDMVRGQLRDVGLDIDEFLKMLVRIALVAYAEPAMGNPPLAVKKLAEFLQLSNAAHVRHVIRTKGRETQGRLYSRSVFEPGRTTSRATIDEARGFLKRKNVKSNDSTDFTASQLAQVHNQPRWAELVTTAESNCLALPQQVMLAQFNENMTAHLKEYCVSKSAQYWVPLNEPGFDLRCLRRDRRYRLRLEIINESKTMLVVTGFSKCGNIASSVSASFNPQPFAAGLHRTIDLRVTPAASLDIECAGVLKIELSSAQGGPQKVTFDVPLYYSKSPVSLHPYTLETDEEDPDDAPGDEMCRTPFTPPPH